MAELDDGLPWETFVTYLSGLSGDSAWRTVAANEPVELDTEDAQRALADL